MSAAVETFTPWRARVLRVVYRHFFDIVFFAMSVSQWVVLWWIFPNVVNALPLVLSVGAPIPIYVASRHLATRSQHQAREHLPMSGWMRAYFAVAFTSLFCGAVLLFVGTLWVSAKFFLSALAAQAWTARAGLAAESGVDVVCHWLANAGLATVGLMFGYGYSIGQQRLKIVRLGLPLRAAPRALHALRIVQISDIHVGQNLGRAELERFVAQVNALAPDLLCITGDIADAPSADLEGFLPLLAKLQARYGIFAILGNHDHYAGADHVAAALRRLTRFTVLRDEQTVIDIDGARLHVIGLDDRGHDWAHGIPHVPYLAATLATIPNAEPVLLLCHRPDVFPQAAAAGVALTLAGHTHGGQLALPRFMGRFRNLAEFITTFDRGLFERDGSYLYVNCGLGVTAQRLRLNAPREITLIEVQAAHALAA